MRLISRTFFVSAAILLIRASAVSAAAPLAGAQPFLPYENEFATAIVMTPRDHQILYSFKPDKPWTAASLTKLPNALVWVRKGQPPYNSLVTMKKQDEVGGGRLRLAVGSKLTFRDLWYSAIAASANNAAMAIARASGLSQKKYVAQMNAEAKRAGAKNSLFVDPAGMDPKNLTTARDMALIAEKAFNNPNIRRATVAGKYTFIVSSSGEKKTVTNTNYLLTKDPDVWVTGGKTGFLEESQYNLAVRMRPMVAGGPGDLKQELIVVVLGAPTKDGSFGAAKRLAQWAWENHKF